VWKFRRVFRERQTSTSLTASTTAGLRIGDDPEEQRLGWGAVACRTGVACARGLGASSGVGGRDGLGRTGGVVPRAPAGARGPAAALAGGRAHERGRAAPGGGAGAHLAPPPPQCSATPTQSSTGSSTPRRRCSTDQALGIRVVAPGPAMTDLTHANPREGSRRAIACPDRCFRCSHRSKHQSVKRRAAGRASSACDCEGGATERLITMLQPSGEA
jgi:hypothetical protein